MRSPTRAGFTLIELMVAMALTLLIMAILSQAFVTALETFSGVKGIGDMQQLLRTASTQLLNDLSNDHLEGKRRVSDPTIADPTGRYKIQSGFFAIRQGAPSQFEGNDQNSLPSYRAVNHVLHMSVKRRGNQHEDFFTAPVQVVAGVTGPVSANLQLFFGASTSYGMASGFVADSSLTLPYSGGSPSFYSSQWAEICYYLEQTGSTEEPINPTSTIGTPIYSLKRAMYVMVPNSTNLNNAPASQINNTELAAFDGIACNVGASPPGKLVFFSPTDAALGNRTLDPATFTAGNARLSLANSTLVLPNVISFDVQVMPVPNPLTPPWNAGTAYVAGNMVVFDGLLYQCVAANTGQAPTNGNFWLPSIGGLYDTARINSGAGYANNFALRAVQITMRVWDTKTRQTRQTTIVQDL